MARLFGLVRRRLRALRGPGRRRQLAGTGDHVLTEPGRHLLEFGERLGQEVGAHGGSRIPLLERLGPRPLGVDVLLLAPDRALDQLGPGPHGGHGLVGLLGGTQRARPLLAQEGLLGVDGRQDRLEFGLVGPTPRRRRFGLGRRQLRRQASRLGLEGRDHVDVGRRVEGGFDAAPSFAQHAREAAGALDQSLHPAERVGQVLFPARRQLGRGRRRLGIQLLEGGVQLALLVPADVEALCRRATARGQLRQFGAGQVAAHRQQLGGHGVVRAGGGRLALQRSDLAPDLAHQVTQALEILGGRRQPALSPLPPAPVLEHTRRLLDDGPPILGPGVQDRVELALADDHVLPTADARVTQQLLDIE